MKVFFLITIVFFFIFSAGVYHTIRAESISAVAHSAVKGKAGYSFNFGVCRINCDFSVDIGDSTDNLNVLYYEFSYEFEKDKGYYLLYGNRKIELLGSVCEYDEPYNITGENHAMVVKQGVENVMVKIPPGINLFNYALSVNVTINDMGEQGREGGELPYDLDHLSSFSGEDMFMINSCGQAGIRCIENVEYTFSRAYAGFVYDRLAENGAAGYFCGGTEDSDFKRCFKDYFYDYVFSGQGSLSKSDLTGIVPDTSMLWDELVDRGYIERDGVIREDKDFSFSGIVEEMSPEYTGEQTLRIYYALRKNRTSEDKIPGRYLEAMENLFSPEFEGITS